MRAGFTLIEMLIVIVIIGIITIVVITSQGNFNKSILLANTTYDVALAMRSAQSYGLGNQPSGSAIAPVGYGLDFNIGTPGTFTLFADTDPPTPSSDPMRCHHSLDTTAPDAKPGDCAYTVGGDTKVTSYTLNNNITTQYFCAFYSSWLCTAAGPVGADPSFDQLDVVFVRPNPSAYISVDGAYRWSDPYTRACLAFASPQGGMRYMAVNETGEIDGNATSCP